MPSETSPTLSRDQKQSAASIIAAQTCTKIGDVLMNPKTVLTWVLTYLGAPGAIISMLVPIRESGSMLPQLIISSWVKRVRRRKWVFIAGALAQALAVASMGLAAMFFSAVTAGWTVLAALSVFAIARAFCSISSKDVLGRSIPKGVRGRVNGMSATLSGLLSAVAAALLIIYRDHKTITVLSWLLLVAAGLWVVGAAVYALVKEPLPEDADEKPKVVSDLKSRFSLVLDDPLFRKFILCRCLLLGSALASPLLVVLGEKHGGSLITLVGFVLASGLASGVSSFLWGKLADRSGSLAMAVGGVSTAMFGFAGIAIALWFEPLSESSWCWPVLFLLFNLGYAGVRIGRKTWVVDAADGDQRTDYVSASNTLIAICIIVMGLVTSALHGFSPLIPLSVYCLFCVIGAGVAMRMHRQQIHD
ncbi:MFS transporter [Oceaniferula spumae]|uniref:MFS transporter n=1 Tax=Oceaniferula spumae TaxID=2979115 RepID=A0AAT9FRZ4_9BACT